MRLSEELLREIGQRVRGLDRYSRGERLEAAHAVVGLTAYFEVLGRAALPFDPQEIMPTKASQVTLAGGGPSGSGRLNGALVQGLLHAKVPMPAPQRPYEASVEEMRAFYRRLSLEVAKYVTGLAVWDRLDEGSRTRFRAIVTVELPDRAVARYEDRFRQLATDFPEIAFWSNLVDHQATREEVRRLGAGLAGLERLVADIAAAGVPDDRRLGLSRAYQAFIERSILSKREAPEGLTLPSLKDTYVKPDFRAVKATGQKTRYTDESWWESQPVRGDLEEFLFGYLVSPQAAHAPLLIMGQPGSGKSVLTQMLAAQLPPEKFLVVRVVLSEVAADADLQAQIEQTVRSATGENLSWPNLVRSADGTLPVVLLDGFDELLLATGVSHSDYLDKVSQFQAREADLGRPVAVLVTSRSAVADRAQPPPGMVVARLEPFRAAQITQWVNAWNKANEAGFAARGLRPLEPPAVLRHTELSSQPLLLTMLALYDGNGDRFLREAHPLGESDLYERLLTSFAEREIRKEEASLDSRQLRDRVERELLRLSVVAFAMFNRNRQWVTADELDVDLPVLLGGPSTRDTSAGFRAKLTAAQVAVGRFYFIHEGQATRDRDILHTYEFLHATFGEYLIARLVTREVDDLADAARLAAARPRTQPPDDAFLQALLSHMPLAMRETILSFAAERMRALPEGRRQQMLAVLLDLFGNCLTRPLEGRYGAYTPYPVTTPARYAAYSANLAVLAVLTAGELKVSMLFPRPPNSVAPLDLVAEWRKLTMLWRSQLPPDGWGGILGALSLERAWVDDGRRDITLSYGDARGQRATALDPYWSYNRVPDSVHLRSERPFGWKYDKDGRLRDQSWFLCDSAEDTATHALEPFGIAMDEVLCSFHSYWPDNGRTLSSANALISMWTTSGMDSDPAELGRIYDTCLEISIRARFPPNTDDLRRRFRTMVFRQLAADRDRLPIGWLDSALRRLQQCATADPDEVRAPAELLQIASAYLPEIADLGKASGQGSPAAAPAAAPPSRVKVTGDSEQPIT